MDNASPPVLSLICEASFALEDYSRAEELLRIFKDHFETSDYMRSAYKLLASGQMAAGKLDEAMATIVEAQEEYGTDPKVAWAQLMKSDALRQMGKFEEAREENLNVMGVPAWRGMPYAQATYQLGQVEEDAGNLLKAHAYYQRAYFQYKGQGEWASLGYLGAARVLEKLSQDGSLSTDEQASYEEARISTLKAMLLDKYANKTPQADEARELLGPAIVAEMEAIIESGVDTNIVVTLEKAKAEPRATTPSDGEQNAAKQGGDA